MEVKNKKVIKILNETQQAHALNRLSSIYSAATKTLANKRVTGRHLNWADKKAVAAFFKKYKLTDIPSMEAAAYIFGGQSLPDNIHNKISAALNKYYQDSMENPDNKLSKASLLLAEAQDKIIFSEVDLEKVPGLITEFETSLTKVVGP